MFLHQNDDVLCTTLYKECKSFKQILTWDKKLIKHHKEERCTGSKWKSFLLEVNSHTNWAQLKRFFMLMISILVILLVNGLRQAVKIGKHIYHNMCRHGEKCEVKFCIYITKVNKYIHISWLMVLNQIKWQYASFVDAIGMSILLQPKKSDNTTKD